MAFALSSAGQETVLYSFAKTPGGKPQGGLIRDSKGNLYGTTQIGGDLECGGGAGCGMVFKLDATGTLTVLHTFGGPDGAHPVDAIRGPQRLKPCLFLALAAWLKPCPDTNH